MSVLQAIILGVVEGLTEFLPVSSTAHLMIFSKLLGVGDSEFLKTFEISIQLGAIFAVLFLYFKKIFSDFSLIKNIIAGFLPTGVVGFLFYGVFKSLLGRADIALAALFLGGVVLILFERIRRGEEKNQLLNLKKSFVIGLWQTLAMIPGVSRSMATILGGTVGGLSKKSAIEFSFLLALPTMFSATIYDLYRNHSLLNFSQWQILLIGFVVAFLSALVSVKFFLKFIEKNSFSSFGWYRIVFATAVLLILF